MSDAANVKIFCPQCGADLHIEQLGVSPQSEDRVTCPTHGFVGRRDEITRHVVEQAQNQVGKQVSDDVLKALKGFGFDVKRL